MKKSISDHCVPEQGSAGSPTIVGGQPPSHKPNRVKVSAGVEQALYLAATDAAFEARLLAQRDRAARAAGLHLRDSEAAVLRNAPRHQLQAFIASLDTSPGNLRRRGFLQAVAASAVAFAAGGSLGACGETDKDVDGGAADKGIDVDAPIVRDGCLSDMPPLQPDSVDGAQPDIEVDAPMVMDGIQPDIPPVKLDLQVELSVDGIMPDMPPTKLDIFVPGPDSAGVKPDK